jgi:hypothetical protein
MALVNLDNFGQIGVIQDTSAESLPVNAFTDARNVRFTGFQIEKILEPAYLIEDPAARPVPPEGSTVCVFSMGWSDALSTYFMAIFSNEDGKDYAYRWDQRTATPTAENPATWEQIGGPYNGGPWQGFEWGNTFIINNGGQAPQIWDRKAQNLIDLPNWGLVSTGNDIANGEAPSDNTRATCRIILPIKNYLVAMNFTEAGDFRPNTVWWSDPAGAASVEFAPSWDYQSPVTLSGQAQAGVGYGNIVTSLPLNDNLIIYTDGDATAMSIVGGRFVMGFRRLFNKGAAGLNSVTEFNNRHYVVARDQIYIHDGSKPELIAKDRVEREFNKRAGLGYTPEFR